MTIERLCKSCGRSFVRYNSLQTKCNLCSYNISAKPKKPMKKMGKVAKKWVETRHDWIKNNPPKHNGMWACELKLSPLCLRYMDLDQLTLDHTIARSKRPDLRYDHNNLKPACLPCNTEKGSS